MKSAIIIILLSLNLLAQDNTIYIRDHEVKLGMDMMEVWDILGPDYNVIEDDAGNFFVSDNKDSPVCVVYFKNEKAVKIIKDWGTTYKTNAGQIFKSLWIILKEHEKDLNSVKIVPQQSYSSQGDKSSILIYITENRYLEITIKFNVTILEVLEDKES
ncbi:MAG: hypothetical protein OEM46_10480 [Ignavibacteria bacterium]|nr:hypothetical protein [Ignavibacteria bacterium]